jgi:hypothetical protein
MAEEYVYELIVHRGRVSIAEVMAEGEPQLQRQALDTLVAKGLVRQLAGPTTSKSSRLPST